MLEKNLTGKGFVTENIKPYLLSVCFLILNIKIRKCNVLSVEMRFQKLEA